MSFEEGEIAIETAQEAVLNWAVNAPRGLKMEFIKSFLDTLNYEEVKTGVMQLCKRAKRRKRNIGGQEDAAVPAPSSAVPSEPQAVLVPVPVVTPWWHKFQNSQMVGLDCEFVQEIIGKRAKGNICRQILASVAIVNHNQEVIYNKTVRRQPMTYHVTPKSTAVNGFGRFSLANGDAPFDVIRKEVLNIIEDKLVIACRAKSDFDALKIGPIDDYDVFDLQSHWYCEKENAHGRIVKERIGLKKIYGMYFDAANFQTGIHSPVDDAKATIKIFLEVYVKIKTDNVEKKENDIPF